MALSRFEATGLEALVGDYRVESLDMPGPTRLGVHLAARDGAMEARGQEIRIRRAAGLPGCMGRIDPADTVIEHVVAESKGGHTVAENLQVLCAACMKAKCPTLP